jgi:hypothetical protein
MGEPHSDFTSAEIFNALRLVMPEVEARRLADSVSKPIDEESIPSQPLQNQAGPGLPYRSIPTVSFSTDTLILLSVVSADTAAKVDRYRAQLRDAGAIGPREEEAWQRRRAELAAWRDAGFPGEREVDDEPDAPGTRPPDTESRRDDPDTQ